MANRGLVNKVAAVAVFGLLWTAPVSAELAPASDGSRDPTFGGSDGKVTTDFGSGYATAHDVAVQPDGKIVAAGGGGGGFTLARYNPDGKLDRTFGGDGRVTVGFGYSLDEAHGVALQPNGKIVAAGAGNGRFALARLRPDGKLDRAFGDGDGKVTTGFGSGYRIDSAYDVAVQPDGKIVAAGRGYGRDDDPSSGPDSFSLARYNRDGRLDSSFGADGRVTVGGTFDQAFAVSVQSDGKIVATGWCSGLNAGGEHDFDFGVVRLGPEGEPDRTFGGGDGLVTTGFTPADKAHDLAVQPDGKIVVAGKAGPTGSPESLFQLARYNPDGSLDASFGTDGRVVTGFTREGSRDESFAEEVLLQPDGKIVAAGGGGGFRLARYNPGGSLDPTFGGDGRVTTGSGGGFALGLALQPDGKLVAAGFRSDPDGEGFDFRLVRYGNGD